MGHTTDIKEHVYEQLAHRLAKNPVGVVIDENLLGILRALYTEREAQIGSKFPLLPMPLERISSATGVAEHSLSEILDDMAKKGLVLDLPRKKRRFYMLSPMVVGFFEYTFMRVSSNVDQKHLAMLFEKYFASDRVRKEIFGTTTKMFRSLIYENLIPAAVETEVLSFERASEIIRAAGSGALSMCACRHKAEHLGTACGAPVDDICTSLGQTAEWLIERGFARRATVEELLSVLERARQHGLVHLGDNVLEDPAFICHCCGCCCGVLRSIRESDIKAVSPSGFVPLIEEPLCAACAVCVKACPISALRPRDSRPPEVSTDKCIGCGVCASLCPTGAIAMSKCALNLPPRTKNEQLSKIARERA